MFVTEWYWFKDATRPEPAPVDITDYFKIVYGYHHSDFINADGTCEENQWTLNDVVINRC